MTVLLVRLALRRVLNSHHPSHEQLPYDCVEQSPLHAVFILYSLGITEFQRDATQSHDHVCMVTLKDFHFLWKPISTLGVFGDLGVSVSHGLAQPL